jgi:hypothetical protein
MVATIAQIDAKVRAIISELQKIHSNLSPTEIEDTLWNTYIFAREAHDGQFRKS